MEYMLTAIKPKHMDVDQAAYDITIQLGDDMKTFTVVANDPAECVIEADEKFYHLLENDGNRRALILEAVWAFHRARQKDARSTVEPYFKGVPRPHEVTDEKSESPRTVAYRAIIEGPKHDNYSKRQNI